MKMTRARYMEIEREIQHIIEAIPAVEQRRSEAQTHGDFRENEPYHLATQNLAELNARLAELQEEFSNASIIETDNLKANLVQMESRLKLEIDGVIVRKTLNSENGGNYFNTISDKSPLGQALLGKQIGDKVHYEDSVGEWHTVKILQIA